MASQISVSQSVRPDLDGPSIFTIIFFHIYLFLKAYVLVFNFKTMGLMHFTDSVNAKPLVFKRHPKKQKEKQLLSYYFLIRMPALLPIVIGKMQREKR